MWASSGQCRHWSRHMEKASSTAWCSEIGPLRSLDAPELHASVTSENQFHCTKLYRRVSHGLGWPANAILFLLIVKGDQESRNTSAPTASNIAHQSNLTWLPFYPIGRALHDLVIVYGRQGKKIAFREFCCKKKKTWRWLATQDHAKLVCTTCLGG